MYRYIYTHTIRTQTIVYDVVCRICRGKQSETCDSGGDPDASGSQGYDASKIGQAGKGMRPR